MKKTFFLRSLFSMLLLFVGLNAFADTKTIEINTTNSGVTGSYATKEFTVSDVTFGYTNWMKSTTIQAKASTTNSCYNTTAIPGVITKITVVQTKSARAIKIYGGTSSKPTTQITSPSTDLTMEFDFSGKNYTYFSMTTPSNAVYITTITIEYEESSSDTRTSTTTSFPESTYSAYIGESFTAPTATVDNGGTVTYESSNTNIATVNASTGAVTLVADGTTTIKASYAGDTSYKPSSASYTLSVGKVYASLADLVAGGTPTTTGIPVKVTLTNETIQSIYTTTSGYRNGIYLKSGNQEVEIYCQNVPDAWVVNGTVSGTVTGTWKLFGSTWEICPTDWTQLTYTAPEKANQTITLGTYKTSMTTADSADSFTATTDGDGALSVESSTPGVATATISEGTVTVTPVAAGTTTITVAAAATDTWNAGSKSYTLTVTEPVLPATLPFSFDGGKADVATTQGMSQTGLGSDYGSSPKLKFDTTGDELIIWYGADAGKLTYTIKGNDFSGGTFDIMESANGTDYTSVKSYTELSSATETATLNAASRYVKFVYTTKDKGNVALGAISITAAGAKEDPKLAFEKTTYTFATNATSMAVKATSAAGSTGAITYALTEGDADKFLIDENDGTIVCETAGTYTVTATIAEDDTYASQTATATVTIEAPTTSSVALVAKYGGKYYAMDCDFDAVEVAVKDGKVYVAAPVKENITWTMATTSTETTFQAFDGEYLAPKSSSTLQLQDASYAWTLDSENNTWSTTVGSTTRSFFYSASAGAFKNYATSNAGKEGYSELAQAYTEIVSEELYSRDVTSGNYGTICIPFDVKKENMEGVENVYSISAIGSDALTIKAVEKMEAGVPYIFKSNASKVTFNATENVTGAPVDDDYLVGTFEPMTAIQGTYVISQNKFWYVDTDGVSIDANKAYIKAQSTGAKSLNIVVEGDEADGISTINANDYENGNIYNVSGQRISTPVRGQMYIMNGKTYIAK